MEAPSFHTAWLSGVRKNNMSVCGFTFSKATMVLSFLLTGVLLYAVRGFTPTRRDN
jgi:hypothetical protein